MRLGTRKQVCELLRISRWTLLKRIKAGLLPRPIPSPPGTRRDLWDLDLLEELMRAAAPKPDTEKE
jgi:predicted site-specific integrase-resolvase